MIKKGGTAEYFGPLRDGNAWRFYFTRNLSNKNAPQGCAGARTRKMLLRNLAPRESLQADSYIQSLKILI